MKLRDKLHNRKTSAIGRAWIKGQVGRMSEECTVPRGETSTQLYRQTDCTVIPKIRVRENYFGVWSDAQAIPDARSKIRTHRNWTRLVGFGSPVPYA